MRKFIYHYSRPIRIVNNRVTAFTASMFKIFCQEPFIQHVKVSSNSQRSNGQAEIISGIIMRSMALITEKNDKTDWDMWLVDVQLSFNSSINRITKKPFDVIHRYSATGMIENLLIN